MSDDNSPAIRREVAKVSPDPLVPRAGRLVDHLMTSRVDYGNVNDREDLGCVVGLAFECSAKVADEKGGSIYADGVQLNRAEDLLNARRLGRASRPSITVSSGRRADMTKHSTRSGRLWCMARRDKS